MKESSKPVYEFAGFRLDTGRRVLRKAGGSVVALTPRVFDTLLQLVEGSGVVLEKEALMAAIWPDQIVEENNLSQNISTLRRALGETPGAPRFILTVPGRGYRFLAEVTIGTGGQNSTAASAQPLRETSLALPARVIAILPFKPLVLAEQNPALELGMADTLIAKLGNNREIVVRPLSSVRRFGAADQDPLAAGRQLEAGAVLDGAIQRAGDQIRVTVRLLQVADGSSLWAGTFDEKFTSVFAVQDAISQKVAQALSLQLTREEEKSLTKHGTQNAAAYERYLIGRYHWNKLIAPELRRSIESFKEATAADPQYAQAYFGLAECYRALAITSDVPSGETMPRARAAAEKAIAIDPSFGEAHASLAFIHFWYDWDWEGAEREAKKAVALSPKAGFCHMAHAHVLSDLGRHDEAMAAAARCRALDPVSLIFNVIEGAVLFYARRQEAAEARLRKAIELNPRFWIAHLFLAKVQTERGEYAEALDSLGKARAFSQDNSEPISLQGYVSAMAGEEGKARTVLEELKVLARQRYIPPNSFAVVHLGLGERDETFAWLEKACADRDVRLSFLKVDPKWDPFRADPRFLDLLRRLGLDSGG